MIRSQPKGKVDKSEGFNRQIVIIFIQSPARSAQRARLFITEIRRTEITTPNGKRNWPHIRVAADRAVLEQLKRVQLDHGFVLE